MPSVAGSNHWWFQPTTTGDVQGSIVVQTRDYGALPALPLTGTGV